MTQPFEQLSSSELTDLRALHSRLQQLFSSSEDDPWAALKVAVALSSVRQAIEVLSGTPVTANLPQPFPASPKPFLQPKAAQKSA